jgi:general secretion pathway protein J
MNAPRRPAAERGFTLVEVLVALVVMAVLASMAWQGIDGIARSRTIADERL